MLSLVQRTVAPGPEAERVETSTSHSLVQLDDDADVGNLPFVNGVLLGYPFIYYVTADNVNRASAWLSSSCLQLFRCCKCA